MTNAESAPLASFSTAIRESTLKRLRIVKAGHENWRLTAESMSFADLAHISSSGRMALGKAVGTRPAIDGRAGRAHEHCRAPRLRGPVRPTLRDGREARGAQRSSRPCPRSDWTKWCPTNASRARTKTWWVIARVGFRAQAAGHDSAHGRCRRGGGTRVEGRSPQGRRGRLRSAA